MLRDILGGLMISKAPKISHVSSLTPTESCQIQTGYGSASLRTWDYFVMEQSTPQKC